MPPKVVEDIPILFVHIVSANLLQISTERRDPDLAEEDLYATFLSEFLVAENRDCFLNCYLLKITCIGVAVETWGRL
jgi:hypothetical protein